MAIYKPKKTIGLEWLIDKIAKMIVGIEHFKPSDFTESTRVLPDSVTKYPGYLRFDVNPYMREIIDCFDTQSTVREVTLMKGVQITATTVLESVILYGLAYLKTVPMQLITADDSLAKIRLENHILPMFEQSGLSGIFQSADIKNKRKSGTAGRLLQVVGGGYILINGAMSERNLRSHPIMFSLQDELDGWPLEIGKSGSTSKLADDRTTSYHDQRKIFRVSTPLTALTSMIYRHYLRGDQRKYLVHCIGCDFPQELRWEGKNQKGEKAGGLKWETEDSKLIADSVRYCCPECGKEHFDHDKERLYSPDNGADWVPTAKPVEKDIRSYHLPGLYSPAGFKSWSSCVIDFMDAYDVERARVKDMGLYKTYYNNILGWPFDPPGSFVSFTAVSSHRRREYSFGTVPNHLAIQVTSGPVLFLTMQIDVHKHNLAVAIMGWTREARCFLIEYWRIEADDCDTPESKAWQRVRELIEDTAWKSDDGKTYGLDLVLIDAGYVPDTVAEVCKDYNAVFPIIGRDRPAKAQAIREFDEFEMRTGLKGYRITVDHYKDRLAPVLRREWEPQDGDQRRYHFNTPLDITKKQLEELTKEKLTEVVDSNGHTSFKWIRPSGAANELWDLLVYGHAAVEIYAWSICRGYYQLETVDWDVFWSHVEQR